MLSGGILALAVGMAIILRGGSKDLKKWLRSLGDVKFIDLL